MSVPEDPLRVNERTVVPPLPSRGLVDHPADLRSARDAMAASRGDDYYTFSSGASVCPYSEGAPSDSQGAS
jgi:hypothetical protein